MARVADQDGDGFDDLLVGCPTNAVHLNPRIIFFSGRSGEHIRTEENNDHFDRYGLGVGNAGDADGDGVEDYAIGNPDDRGGHGKVEVKSGVDGSLIRDWTGIEPNQKLGDRVGCVGDVNADGWDDLAFTGGRLFVTSGLTGQLLYRFSSGNFCRAQDLNGDGHDDIAVAYPLARLEVRQIHCCYRRPEW